MNDAEGLRTAEVAIVAAISSLSAVSYASRDHSAATAPAPGQNIASFVVHLFGLPAIDPLEEADDEGN